MPAYINSTFSGISSGKFRRRGENLLGIFPGAKETGRMGIVRTASSRNEESEEFHRTLPAFNVKKRYDEALDDDRGRYRGAGSEKLVCVTSGASYLGIAIVHQLLNRGYSVRLALDNIDDLEKLREMELFRDGSHQRVLTLVVKLTELSSLCNAFDGCHGVFHTSSFIDPNGISGYSKWMADLEYRASQTVIEACARTLTVRKCIFTSSLLTCIWRNGSIHDLSPVLDESCWSDESFCREKELWLALGKTMAEKAAWNTARDRDVRLITICPGLITGPQFRRRNPTASTAYLKGANAMYKQGLLATVDVSSVAKANMCVYEDIGNRAGGRYICFDRIVDQDDEAIQLEQQMGIPDRIAGNTTEESPGRFQLSNRKLSRLSLEQPRCFDDE